MEAPTFSPPRSPARRQSRSPKKNGSPLKQVLVREAQRAQKRPPSAPPTPKVVSPAHQIDNALGALCDAFGAERVHLTPERAQNRPLKPWERQARPGAQKNGKTRKVWKRPLAQQQGPNGELPSQNTRAKWKSGEYNDLVGGVETPKKILKKVRVESDTPLRDNAQDTQGRKVKQRVVGRERRRSSLPHKQRTISSILDETDDSGEKVSVSMSKGIAEDSKGPYEAHKSTAALDLQAQETAEDHAKEIAQNMSQASKNLNHSVPLPPESSEDCEADHISEDAEEAMPSADTPRANFSEELRVAGAEEQREEVEDGQPQYEAFEFDSSQVTQQPEGLEDIENNFDAIQDIDRLRSGNINSETGISRDLEEHSLDGHEAQQESSGKDHREGVMDSAQAILADDRVREATEVSTGISTLQQLHELANQEDEDLTESIEDQMVVIQAPDQDGNEVVEVRTNHRHHEALAIADDAEQAFSPVQTSTTEDAEAEEDLDDTSSTLSSFELDAMLADDTATLKPSQVLNDTGVINAPSSSPTSPSQNLSISTPQRSLFTHKVSPPDLSPKDLSTQHPTSASSPETATCPAETQPLTPSQITALPLNDDETLLHDFLARSKASKAARIASQEHAAHRRDSDAIKDALSNRNALEEITANVTSPPTTQTGSPSSTRPQSEEPEGNMASPTLILDFKPPSVLQTSSPHSSMSSPRRRSSRRTRRPSTAPSHEDDPAPTRISLRHAPSVHLLPRKSEAQQLALATRANTRKNKGGAVDVQELLLKMKNDGLPAEEELIEAKGVDRGTKGREVKWREELVSYFNETKRDVFEVEGAVEASSASAEEARPATRRKRALGAVNGTPAKMPRSVTEEVEDGGRPRVGMRRSRSLAVEENVASDVSSKEHGETEAIGGQEKGGEARVRRSGLPRMSGRRR